jgi:hypothetical protein
MAFKLQAQLTAVERIIGLFVLGIILEKKHGTQQGRSGSFCSDLLVTLAIPFRTRRSFQQTHRAMLIT